MKNFSKLFLMILLFFFGISASHASLSVFNSVYITGLNIDAGGNNILFIRVNQPVGTGGCHTDTNWNFAISLDPVINPTGKYMYMQMLAAKSGFSPVTIYGTANCPAFNTIQGIQRIEY